MKNTRQFAAVLFCWACFSLLSQAAYSQDFSGVSRDLEELENLIAATLTNTEEQQRLLEDLQRNLNESGNTIEAYGNTITRQEQLLADLQSRLNEMSETYRKQSALSAKYEKSSKFWKIFTLIGIPTAALLGGALTAALSR